MKLALHLLGLLPSKLFFLIFGVLNFTPLKLLKLPTPTLTEVRFPRAPENGVASGHFTNSYRESVPLKLVG